MIMPSMNLEVNINVEDTFIFPNEKRVEDRWGLARDYLKDHVRNRATHGGHSFENDAARVVICKEGFFYEFFDMPESFYGSTRAVSIERLTDDEARSSLWEAISLYRSGEGRVMVIYGPNYREDYRHIFLGHYLGYEPLERGEMKVEVPMFFRVDVDALETSGLVGGDKGVAFFIRTKQGENILIRLPREVAFSGVMQGIRD
jgi:hypothetical protein